MPGSRRLKRATSEAKGVSSAKAFFLLNEKPILSLFPVLSILAKDWKFRRSVVPKEGRGGNEIVLGDKTRNTNCSLLITPTVFDSKSLNKGKEASYRIPSRDVFGEAGDPGGTHTRYRGF